MKKKASKILLIEDDISLGQTVSELLEVNDYEVKWCQNGLEAYHYLETKIPDIIVCDLMMPIMSGEELFFKIRKLKKYDEIPFLIITADMTFETKLKQLENGVNDFINKPFKIQELIFKIKNFLQYKETLMKRTIQDPFSKVTIKLKNKNFFERLNEVIIKNIKSNITIEKIASELFISKSALDKKIRRDKQVNTTKYIREFRIEYAIRLIEAGETNVQQLADSCGFNSLSYFSISFKEYTNTSPKSYIKKRNLN
ncbi:MAG TPA: response regulator [Flavobacterium sp.]|uniref:response regulator transcription factor n=1 Tax=Flavobacterium sp. TaxID=239 RepID=UPI002B4AF478|nr:response regulator [Flavobacterium sp.]HLO72399.1 response regulator [Flavobacterium sp.]